MIKMKAGKKHRRLNPKSWLRIVEGLQLSDALKALNNTAQGKFRRVKRGGTPPWVKAFFSL